MAPGVRCCVCVNVATQWPASLAEPEIHTVTHGRWSYICCRLHAPMVHEHGIVQAVKLLKHTNPTEHAT